MRSLGMEEMNCNSRCQKEGWGRKRLQAGVDNKPSSCEPQQPETQTLHFKITAFIRSHLGDTLILQPDLRRERPPGWVACSQDVWGFAWEGKMRLVVSQRGWSGGGGQRQGKEGRCRDESLDPGSPFSSHCTRDPGEGRACSPGQE